MNYAEMPNRPIMCIDMKCFYASCIAMLHGINILETPVAVVANFNQPGSVVLAASPLMKEKYKIKTGSRRYEIPKHPDIQMSMTITKLIANYVPVDAIHVYSVDESFVDLTGTEKLWGSPEQAAREIQAAILDQYNVPSAVGLGPNMLMAKLALDLEAKKTGFARWTYDDIPKKLWPVRPLSEMWGIGKQMEANLNKMGIQTVGGLANADLNDLEEQFGVMGNQLYHHAWGIDLSKLGEPLITNGALSFGKGQMLMRDYHTRKDLLVVLLEMCEDVMKRARDAGFVGRTISLGLSYSRNAMTKGFHRSRTINTPTNETLVMYKTCIELLDEHFAGEPARQLSVRISNLEREHSIQLDLFDERKPQRQLIGPTMDAIRNRFGATALLRAVSFTGAGTAIKRDRLVGGHLA